MSDFVTAPRRGDDDFMPMIVVATKLDATTDRARLEALRAFCSEHNLEFHAISAATGEGVRELVRSIADALDKIPRPAPDAADAADDQISDSSVVIPASAGEHGTHAPLVSRDEKS